jgi:hypothetical protein
MIAPMYRPMIDGVNGTSRVWVEAGARQLIAEPDRALSGKLIRR